MENIILGLLLLQSRTIYQLRKRINDGLNLMYSCSTGSIQAAIKKLLRNGYITVSEITEKGKLKKIYIITDNGKNYFNNWLNSPIDNGSAKNPELSKIYFLGFAEKETRIKLIESHIADLKKIRLDLEKICNEGATLASEIQNNDILYFQLQTATYGRDLMKFNIEWYNRLLKNVKEQ
ncbi:MAG: PadR family transcriptional regulator [Clostridia bacterium]|nr:PadR family transcriptional regulator [Clostridia bacterium]